jgi:AAA family ATP:ADP antiporter
MAAIAIVGAGIAAVWAIVGVYLGKLYNQERGEEADSKDTIPSESG